MRLAACLLLLAASATVLRGRVLGRALRPDGASTVAAVVAVPTGQADTPARPSAAQVAALAVLAAAAVVPLRTQSRRWRTALLALNLAVLGIWHGLFLSTARLVAWTSAGLPREPADRATALLLLAMAFIYPLFGRTSHYCLQVCPFGAAQELAGRIPARRWRLPPTLARRLSAFRSLLWTALMLATWCGAWGRWMEWELFSAFAWRAVPPLVTALALVFIVLAVFIPRPYCRFICPTGAFLSLPTPPSTTTKPPMKSNRFLTILVSSAIVLTCARLHVFSAPDDGAAPATAPADGATILDSTGLAPDVRGFGGPVPVEVEVRDGRVIRVAPKLPNDETPGFFQKLDEAGLWKAWDGLPVDVAATARVDAVTSATYSSRAAIANVRAALAAANDAAASPAPAGDAAPVVIQLPEPRRDTMPLGAALAARATRRAFSSDPLSDQELSDLLWAANGYNRPAERKRTAPTAINRQEIDLYVCRADGAWLWDPAGNTLQRVSEADLRGFTGRMNAGPDNFALAASVALVYVIDYERQGMQSRPRDAFKYASVDCGFVGQNVYLHCAAAGLDTVFLGSLAPEKIAEALALPDTRVPLFAQTVGRPAAPAAP